MNKDDLNLIKEIDFEKYNSIVSKIGEDYKQSIFANIADGLSTFLYFIGFIILITLPQNLFVISNSGKRKYSWNWLISLLGGNFLFFLYFGEQRRYNKHFDSEIEKLDFPKDFELKKKLYEKSNNLTESEINNFIKHNIFNIENISKKYVEVGSCFGSSVKTKNATTDILAWIKNMRGGKIDSYRMLMIESRNNALEDLYLNAVKSFEDFDAIVNIRFSTTEVVPKTTEVLVYGTIVKFTK